MGSPSDNKQIRVFISSTFRDMQEERDALVKLFRQLDHAGRKQGITITPLDLRWGITEDQKRNGLVISTCLQEIDNSRPFFIGLLGDRYGWVPTEEELEQNPDLIKRFPNIIEYSRRDLSITEMEMRYGVLDNPLSPKAIFLKKRDMRPENSNHEALIKDIIASPNAQLCEYGSIEELKEIVRKEFSSLLEDNDENLVDEHETAKIKQLRIIKDKAKGYIDFNNYKSIIDKWMASDEPELVITGQAGSGKSSLIASWVNENKDRFDHVIYYSIGEGDEQETPDQINNYFYEEIHKIFDMEEMEELLEEFDDIFEDLYTQTDNIPLLETALEQVEKHNQSLLLVIDGIDHIKEESDNKLLYWLPGIHENVKIIASTKTGDISHNAIIENRNSQELEIEPLNRKNTETLIREYLAYFGKNLDDDFIKMLSENPIYHQGSFLKLMLDDLVAYGCFEELPYHITNYAKARDQKDFFIKALQRAEDYYGIAYVRQLFILLEITNNGLYENDIKEIMAIDELPWSELYCGLKNYLLFVNGKIKVRYSELNNAIHEKYINKEKNIAIPLRKKIIEVISNKESEFEEIAFQAYSLGDWKLLYSTIRPLEIMAKIAANNKKLLLNFWKELQHQNYSFGIYIKDIQNSTQNFMEFYIEDIINFTEKNLEDSTLTIKIIEAFISLLDDEVESQSLRIGYYLKISQIYSNCNKFEEAKNYLSESKNLIDKFDPDDDFLLGKYYFTKGVLLSKQNKLEEALDKFKTALDYQNMIFHDHFQWELLKEIGKTLFSLKRYEESIEYLEQALEYVISIRTSTQPDSIEIKNILGACYQAIGLNDKSNTDL